MLSRVLAVFSYANPRIEDFTILIDQYTNPQRDITYHTTMLFYERIISNRNPNILLYKSFTLVSSLSLRIVTELTKVPNFAQLELTAEL